MGILNKILGDREESARMQSQLAALARQLEDVSTEKYYDNATKLIEPGDAGNLNYFGAIQQDLDVPTLQKLFATEGWFYIVVSTIAKTIAALPVKVERKNVTTQNGARVESWDDASGEPEQALFRNPNPYVTAFEFWWLIIVDLLSTGDAFMYVDQATAAAASPLQQQAPKLRAEALYRVNPATIEPIPSKDGVYLDGYAIKLQDEVIGFLPEQIIHIKMPNPMNAFKGLAPIVAVYKNMLIDRYSQEHMIRFYKQGARLGGVVTTGQKLSKDQLTRLQRSFEQDYTGRHNHHRTLILPQGMDYKPIEQNPGETSLIEFQKANKEPILSAYNVPPIKIGLLDGATFANAIVQQKVYFTDTIMPILTLCEQSINKHPAILPAERMLRAKYDLSQIEALQENQKELADVSKAMLEGGMSVNEVRQRIWKLGPADGGDVVPAIAKATSSSFGQGALPTMAGAKPGATKDPVPEAPKPQIAPEDLVEGVREIVASVADGTLPRDAAIELIVLLGLSREDAERVMGSVGQRQLGVPRGTDGKDGPTAPGTTNPNEDAALIGSDVKPTGATFEERVAQLTAQYIAEGMEPSAASARAIEQAKLEGLTPAEPAATPQDNPTGAPPQKGKHPFTVEQLQDHWKTMSETGIEKLYSLRADELKDFLDKLSKLYSKRFEKNLRKHGLHYFAARVKAGDEIDEDALAELVDAEAQKITDGSLTEAGKYGFEKTLTQFAMDYPDEAANAAIKEQAAKNVKYVSDAVRADIREIIGKATEDPTSVQNVANEIRDYFGEKFSEGRVNRIVRTEVLQGVSLGQKQKITEFKKENPKEAKRLRKIWITSRDERVRGNPDGLYPDTEFDHFKADSEVVDYEEKFSTGLAFPRDPSGDPGNIINCRCAWMTFLADDEADVTEILAEGSPAANAEVPEKSFEITEVKAMELPPRRWGSRRIDA